MLVASGGPDVSREAAQALAADLHDAAQKAIDIVADITELSDSAQIARKIPVYVLDRPGWAYAAAQSLAHMAQMNELADDAMQGMGSFGIGVGMTVLARMILGQFDPFSHERTSGNVRLEDARGSISLSREDAVYPLPDPLPEESLSSRADVGGTSLAQEGMPLVQEEVQLSPGEEPCGRLLLNAPNIEKFRGQYNLDQRDLCLWVCAHELTHAVQFAAAPWMREYIVSRFVAVLHDADEDGSLSSPPAQELDAAMSVLEGHAEFVMNSVTVRHMPSKGRLISAMEEHRKRSHPLKRQLVQVLSLDKKFAQYRVGAEFIRHVVENAGMARVNQLWQEERFLPSMDELHNPDQWLERVGRIRVSGGGGEQVSAGGMGSENASGESIRGDGVGGEKARNGVDASGDVHSSAVGGNRGMKSVSSSAGGE